MSVDWKELPSLASLRAFDATARYGGFSDAARSLNVTHAAIAQQVRSLEKSLGVKLAVRSGRKVQLTEAGAVLSLGLDKGFSAIAASIEDLREKETSRGLRVTTTTFVADSVIVPRLPEFWSAHPGVEIALNPTPRIVDIVGEGFDCGIRAFMEGEDAFSPGIDAYHLSRARVLAVGSSSLVGDRVRDATDYPWLWHENNDSKMKLIHGAGLDPETLKKVTIGSASLQLEAVRQGLGITIFNERFVQDDLAAGRLRKVPLPKTPRADYYLVVPKGPRRPVLNEFLDWIRSIF